MCFNQNVTIRSLNRNSLKLDQFIYLGINISSTENDVDILIKKAWSVIDSLTTISKSDKIKRECFRTVLVSVLLYSSPTWILTKRLEKRLDENYTKILRAVLNVS